MLLDNPFVNDRRVQREAETLTKNGYNVTIICTLQKELPIQEVNKGVQIYRKFTQEVFDPKKRKAHKNWAKTIIQMHDFDIVHAHDHTMLSIGAEIKKIKKTILIYDSHELFHSWPLNLSIANNFIVFIKSYLVRKYFIQREKNNAKQIDFLITVNHSLAIDLKNYFKLKEQQVLTLRNTPEYGGNKPKTSILREKFNIPKAQKILVFIGANIYLQSLNIEQVLEEFSTSKEYAIVIIATFNEHCAQVKKLVKEKRYTNVYFHNKIEPKDINSYLSSADVGLVPTWNRKDLSYWYALDNKLFEYIQAGIPVLATAQPEYKLIVDEEQCGVCINPEIKNAYITGMNAIIDKYALYTEKTNLAAQKLNWENEQEKLLTFYQKTVHKPC